MCFCHPYGPFPLTHPMFVHREGLIIFCYHIHSSPHVYYISRLCLVLRVLFTHPSTQEGMRPSSHVNRLVAISRWRSCTTPYTIGNPQLPIPTYPVPLFSTLYNVSFSVTTISQRGHIPLPFVLCHENLIICACINQHAMNRMSVNIVLSVVMMSVSFSVCCGI